MKKGWMCAATLILSAGTATAARFAAGPKAGVILSEVRPKEQGEKLKAGFSGGGFFRWSPHKNFALQPELLFVMKGVKTSTTTTQTFTQMGQTQTQDTTTNTTTKVNYLELPILAKLLIPTRSRFTPTIFAGPYVAARLGPIKTKGTIKPQNQAERTIDVSEGGRRVDWGFTFGLGTDVRVGEKGMIAFDARYDLGLNKLQRDTSDKNRAWIFMLGYGFAF